MEIQRRSCMTEYIYLFIGRSGSGKTTVANCMKLFYRWKTVDSYTTRSPRYDGEDGHVFVTKEEFDLLPQRCAYTLFDGHEYCATSEQVDRADIYIIDPDGLDYFMKHYHGIKKPIAVWFDLPTQVLKKRLSERQGENFISAERRMENDNKKFSKIEKQLNYYDELNVIRINNPNWSPETIGDIIANYDRGLKNEEVYCSC